MAKYLYAVVLNNVSSLEAVNLGYQANRDAAIELKDRLNRVLSADCMAEVVEIEDDLSEEG